MSQISCGPEAPSEHLSNGGLPETTLLLAIAVVLKYIGPVAIPPSSSASPIGEFPQEERMRLYG
jgi:hypothetical protein